MSTNRKSYYDGHHRFVRDGIPCRMAWWVKDLTAWGRDQLLRGSDWDNEHPSGSRLTKVQRQALCNVRFPQTQYGLFDQGAADQAAAARTKNGPAEIIAFSPRARHAVGMSA